MAQPRLDARDHLRRADRRGLMSAGTWFGAHLRASALAAGSRTALVFEGDSWKYAQLDLAIRRAVQGLAAHGVRSGDRVIVQGVARPDAIVSMFAVARMGAILVPIHPHLTAAERAVVVEETTPRAAIGDASFIDASPAGIVGLTWEQATSEIDGPDPEPPAGSATVIIAFTSGTSGRPKGVALTHDNLHWSMVNGLARLPVHEGDVTLVATPLAHVAILGGLPQYTWSRRGTVVLAPRFTVDSFIDLVRDYRVTTAFTVPTMLSLLTQHPRFDTPDMDSLRWVLAGGAPAVSAVTTRLLDRGIGVVNSYGLTEASAGVTYADVADVAKLPTSAGLPVPHIELCVVGEDGAPAAVGDVGELWLRGPSVASSYWTRQGPHPITDPAGWFHTGDRARRDATGRLDVVGRIKDTIITGGENVDPAEVENALSDLPGCNAIAVCGSPDAVWGEVVTALMVAGDRAPSIDDVRRHLDGRLARHKWPRRLHLVPALPIGQTGKLQREALKTLLVPNDQGDNMTATMRAARMHHVGEPMKIEDVAVPEPGPGDVRVAVHAVNVVPNLANILSNWTTWFPESPLPTLPAIFGLDPAGVVDAVGDGIEGVAVGDRVYVNPERHCGSCRSCRHGDFVNCARFAFAGYFGFSPNAIGLLDRYQGGLAEYMVAPAYALVKLPAILSFNAAARFGYLGTMYSALRKAGAGPGKAVLVNGISGTLGLGAALLAPALGLTRLYGTGRDQDLLDQVDKLAPGRFRLHSLREGPVDEWIHEETAGQGVDIYIDALGPGAPHETFLQGMRSLTRGGVAVNIGAIAGDVPMDLHWLMDHQHTLIGSVWFTAGEGQAMVDMIEAGLLDLSPLQHNVFPLERVNEAISSTARRNGGFSNFIISPRR
jgi:fatty-acyl-CoA synthase